MNNDAVTALLRELIDYAGLFPPAEQSMEAALRDYAAHRAGDDSWMLGRFIVPAARLGELARAGRDLLRDTDEPLRLSVLIGGGATREESLETVAEQARAIFEFSRAHVGAAKVEVLETALPPDAVRPRDDGRACTYLADLCARLGAADVHGQQLYIEIPSGTDWRPGAEATVEGMRICMREKVLGGPSTPLAGFGLKLRCGGLSAEAFPPSEKVAWYLAAARELGLPLKCTAGLHHPLPNTDRATGGRAHGFLNVFGAGLLAGAHQFDAGELLPVLDDRDAADFGFDDTGFRWRDRHVTTADIVRLRREALAGFGSCSFDEPRDDLRALGYLE